MARRSKAREIAPEVEGSIATEPIPDDGSGLIDLGDEPLVEDFPAESVPIETDLRKLPKCPSAYLKYDQLIEYLTTLTALHWSHVMVYIYRVWPIVYRDPKYIDCVASLEEVKEERIISEFGGGVYKLMVCDLDLKRNTKISEAKLTISHVDHEPILNYAELDTSHRDNKSFVQRLIAKGVLDQNGNVIGANTVQQQQAREAGDIGALTATLQQVVNSLLQERRQAQSQGKTGIDEQVIKQSLDMVGGAYKSALETAVKQGNVGEVDQMSKVMSMFTQMIGLLKPAESTSTTMFEKILAIQADNHKAQLDLMREMMKARNDVQNPGGQLEGVLGMIEKVKNIFGLEAGSVGKPSTLETVLDKAPTILDSLTKITGNFAQITTARAAMAGVAPRPAAPSPGAMISPSAQPIPPSATIIGPEAQTLQSPTIVDDLGFDPIAFCNQYGPTILSWINNNKTGYELAEWVEGGFGTTVYLSIRNIGKAKILRAMQMVPEYWQLIAPIQPQAEQFIDEFIAYADTPADGEDEPGGTNGVEKPN